MTNMDTNNSISKGDSSLTTHEKDNLSETRRDERKIGSEEDVSSSVSCNESHDELGDDKTDRYADHIKDDESESTSRSIIDNESLPELPRDKNISATRQPTNYGDIEMDEEKTEIRMFDITESNVVDEEVIDEEVIDEVVIETSQEAEDTSPMFTDVATQTSDNDIKSEIPFLKKKLFWLFIGIVIWLVVSIILIIVISVFIVPLFDKKKNVQTSSTPHKLLPEPTISPTKFMINTTVPTKLQPSYNPNKYPPTNIHSTSPPTKYPLETPSTTVKPPFLPTSTPTSGATWAQRGQDIDGEASADFMGISVSQSFEGKILAGGANQNDGNGSNSGHVQIYSYSPSTKSYSKLGQNIEGEASNDFSGNCVRLSANGMTVAIGAPYNDRNGSSSGHVRVYSYQEDTWVKLGQDIDGEAEFNYFGESLDISSDGSIVTVGAYGHDGIGVVCSGYTSVYFYSNNNWSQIGQTIYGEASNDRFGISVSLSAGGTIVAIGADRSDKNGSNSGHVRVYSYDDETDIWSQLGQDMVGEAPSDFFGKSVSISSDGMTIAIGAYGNHGVNGPYSGSVRVFSFISNSWYQKGQDIDGESSNNGSGYSASLSADGNIVAIGGYRSYGSGQASGQVRVFSFDDGSWNQLGQDIDGEAAGDYSGCAVSLSGDGKVVAIGAYTNDGGGTSSGHVRVYSLV